MWVIQTYSLTVSIWKISIIWLNFVQQFWPSVIISDKVREKLFNVKILIEIKLMELKMHGDSVTVNSFPISFSSSLITHNRHKQAMCSIQPHNELFIIDVLFVLVFFICPTFWLCSIKLVTDVFTQCHGFPLSSGAIYN